MSTTQIKIILTLTCGMQIYSLIQVNSTLRQLRQIKGSLPVFDTQRLTQSGSTGFSTGALRILTVDSIKKGESLHM